VRAYGIDPEHAGYRNHDTPNEAAGGLALLAAADEESVLAPPDRRLPGRHWPENRALVTICTTSSIWLCLEVGPVVAAPAGQRLRDNILRVASESEHGSDRVP
jgi:hypothetical protein